MAYVFDKINNALAGQESGKQDIFGQQGIEPQPGGEAPAGGSPEQQSGVKTTTEGADVGGGTGGGSTQAGENVPQEAAKQSAAVVRRNVGKVSNPAFAQRIGSDISSAEQGLQEEANKYVQGARASQNLGEDVYGKAVSGDQEAFGNISGLLGRSAASEGKVYQQFAPETNINISDVDALRSSAGIGQLLQKEAGPALTQRELELDRSVLERSPEFVNIRNQLIGQQGALTNTAAELQGSKTTEAQRAYQAAIEQAQAAAKGGLGSQQAAIQAELDRRAAEENAAREALRTGGNKDFVSAQQKAVIDALSKSYTDPYGAGGHLKSVIGGIDPSKFYQVGGNVESSALVNQEEANKFNLINQLLGTGKVTQAGTGAGERETFQSKEFQAALDKAARAKDAEANAAAQSQIEKIIAEAKKQATSEAVLRAGISSGQNVGGFYDPALQIQKELASQYGDAAQNAFSTVGMNKFANVAGNVGYQNLLTPAQAAQLNAAQQELSQAGTYKAGSGIGSRGTFDADAYKQALLSILNVPKPTTQLAPAPASIGTGTQPFISTGDAAAIGQQASALGQQALSTLDQSFNNPGGKAKKKFGL